jgi:hypothetical protein
MWDWHGNYGTDLSPSRPEVKRVDVGAGIVGKNNFIVLVIYSKN